MGKKRAQKDRAYLTATEWREEHGGFKGGRGGPDFKRLPFTHCAISFQPFEDAVCTADGTCMDIVNAVPYIQKFKKHPVSGAPLELKDLIRLTFHKNADNEYHCPVLNKVFTEHTHIVAVRTTGNVYCYEALEELCLKPKNMRDLLTDEPFTRKDIIHLQDPLNLSGKNLAEFDHVKKELAVDEEERAAEEADPMFYIKGGAAEDTKRALEALNSREAAAAFAAGGGGRKAQAERMLAEAKAAAAGGKDGAAAAAKSGAAAAGGGAGPDPRLRSAPRQDLNVSFKPGAATWNTDEPGSGGGGVGSAAAEGKEDPSAGRKVPKPYSQKTELAFTTTGAASRAFTSTAMAPATKNERTVRLIQLKPQKKGYLRLHTNLGDLNLELHCDIAPRTCENFMALAEGGYYNDTLFHRSIKNFMAQGGDPTGTGRGGESVWGPTFDDELDSRLLHSGRGVLSMANSGKNTNGSQFFVLYKSAHHLDYKHTVFGRVVGGFEVLSLMEKVPTDGDDRPLQDIRITGASIFVNPYKDLLEEEAAAEAAAKKAAEKEAQGFAADDEWGSWWTNPASAPGSGGGGGGGGVGKYLAGGGAAKPAAAPAGTAPAAAAAAAAPAAKKAKTAAGGYGNFDAW